MAVWKRLISLFQRPGAHAPAGVRDSVTTDDAHRLLDEIIAKPGEDCLQKTFSLVFHSDPAVRDRAGAMMPRMVELRRTQLYRSYDLFDEFFSYPPWLGLSPKDIKNRTFPATVWAGMTTHHNGFVREKALRKLIASGDLRTALPYIVLRITDWVPPIRALAAEAIKTCFTVELAAEWVHLIRLWLDLRRSTRADNSWIDDKLRELFQNPAAGPELDRLLRSDDRVVSRWAFSVAIGPGPHDRASYLVRALNCSDVIVRLATAKRVKESKDLPGRPGLLALMRSDSCPQVRRQALYAMLEEPSESRLAFLKRSLLDPAPGMRDAARFYLREEASRGGPAFDARAFYLNAIETPDREALSIAIAGLGECGEPADAERAAGFALHPRPSVASAAVRAVGALNPTGREDWFEGLLASDQPGVAREACNALIALRAQIPVDRLRELAQTARHPHTRRFATMLLLRQNPYDCMPDAVRAAASLDPSIAAHGRSTILNSRRWTLPIPPTESQRLAVLAALKESPRPLPASVHQDILYFMKLPSGK